MEASSHIQSNILASNRVGVNAGEYEAGQSAQPEVGSTGSSESDTLTLTSTNIVVARQILTEQIDIALDIKSRPSSLNYSEDDSEHLSNAAFGQDLTNKVMQKIQDESSHDGDHDDEHHANVVKTVSLQVAQGFEEATSVINRLGVIDEAVASDVAQTRAQVDQVIDQQAAAPAQQSNSPVISETATAVAAATATTQEFSSSLQVTTREGDLVTINFTRSQELIVGNAISGNSLASYMEASSNMQLDFSVQGDLNKKESESIRKVVEQVNELARKVMDGKIGAALERLDEFKINVHQLADVALTMSRSITHQAIGVYAQIGEMAAASSSDAPASNAAGAETGMAVSVGNSSVVASTASVFDTVPVDRTAAPQSPQEPAATTVSQLVLEATDVITGAQLSGGFENPLKEVTKLFFNATDLMSIDNDQVSKNHSHLVKELFKDLVERLDDDHHDHHQHHDRDDQLEKLLEI